jgi:hypothetical protein
MAEKEPEEVIEEEKTGNATTIALVIIMILIAAGLYMQIQPKSQTYDYTLTVAGVPVYSQIPLEEIQYLRIIALFNESGKAATTCNFELYALSTVISDGYGINIEEGDKGIYIQKNAAYIKGNDEDDILQACNVFLCMREGIECSEGLWGVKDSIVDARMVNVILDKDLRGTALQGHGEIMGALGYIQEENRLTDFNGDGRIEEWEVEKSLIKIFQYIKDGDECKIQHTTTMLQKLNTTNETFKCGDLHPSITLVGSEKNSIEVRDGDVTVSGDDEHMGSAGIILRDAISPEFVRALYRRD